MRPETHVEAVKVTHMMDPPRGKPGPWRPGPPGPVPTGSPWPAASPAAVASSAVASTVTDPAAPLGGSRFDQRELRRG